MGQVHDLIAQRGIENARRLAAHQKQGSLCIDAAYEVMVDEAAKIGITHAGFAMASLPYKRVDGPIWKRVVGPPGREIALLIESGVDRDGKPIGIPYGAVARIILIYLQGEAVRNRSREVELGASMNDWMARMGMARGGHTATTVRAQARLLSRCRLTFLQHSDNTEMVTNGAFVRNAILPLDTDTRQGALWQERVRLDEGFYQSLIEHPLPLREAAIRQIANRPMAIDLYIWLAYRLHVLRSPCKVSWPQLHRQFGASYGAERAFRRFMLPNLELVLAVYPEATVNVDEKKGLTLHPSAPPVAERKLVQLFGGR